MYDIIAIFRQKLGPGIYNFDVIYNNFKNNTSMIIGYAIYNTSNGDFQFHISEVPHIMNSYDIKENIIPDIKKLAKQLASINV